MKSDFPFLSALPSGKSLEGYLYPDTYFLDPNSSIPEQLIKSQLKNFNQKVWIPLGDQLQSFGYGFDSYKLLTLASVIENEEKLAENKPIIAGIFSQMQATSTIPDKTTGFLLRQFPHRAWRQSRQP